ncbi:MAG TPA: hypothetical protein VMU21_11000 [Thermodesulfovibrionales bacterium]|nr:hypothetical protein [Thermodesulfovibrionales bacterium]
MKNKHTEQKERSAFPTHSVAIIKEAVEQGASFDQACSLVAIKDPELREVVFNSALKALVSDMHLSRGMPLKQLAMKLGLSLSRVINAKERIL